MFKKLLLTSALLATFASAHAQSSQNFGVTGTVSPAPCNVTLTGGTVNLGTLSQATVKGYPVLGASNSFYTIPTVLLPIGIVCAAATKVEVSFIDNKAGQNLPFNSFDIVRFGVTDGASGTTPIGAYVIGFSTATTTIDNVAPAVYLSALNGSTTWSNKTALTSLAASLAAPGYTTGFAKTATATAPDSFTTLSGNLSISIYLGKTYIDSATTAVTPTGSGTLTLVYL